MWRADNGDVFEWEMNGSSVIGSGTVYSGVDSNWSIWASGDFDGDGRSDLAWYNPFANGALVWLMNGLTVKQFGGSYSTTNLEPISVSDFNNDGKAEMMFRTTDASSNLTTWFFSGVTRTSTAVPWTSFGIGFTGSYALTDPSAP